MHKKRVIHKISFVLQILSYSRKNSWKYANQHTEDFGWHVIPFLILLTRLNSKKKSFISWSVFNEWSSSYVWKKKKRDNSENTIFQKSTFSYTQKGLTTTREVKEIYLLYFYQNFLLNENNIICNDIIQNIHFDYIADHC